MNRIRKYLRLAKPESYGTFFDFIVGYLIALPVSAYVGHLGTLLLIFVSFTVLVYPGIYIINDLIDLPRDRQHPVKKYRPIASGEIKRGVALLAVTAFLLLGFVLGFLISPTVLLFEILFVVINLLYSSLLKHIPYVDLFASTVTHPLRTIFAICVFGCIGVQYWTVLVSIACMWLVFNSLKRHRELTEVGTSLRASLRGYSKRSLIYITISCCLILLMLFFWCDSLILLLVVGVASAFSLALLLGYTKGRGRIEKILHYMLNN